MRGLRGVVLAPSSMESTSLLFAHGLDLFYTRLSPSRTFDLLPDDFPFALLVGGAGAGVRGWVGGWVGARVRACNVHGWLASCRAIGTWLAAGSFVSTG